MSFIKVMTSGTGRLSRVLGGLMFIGAGAALGGAWLILSLVGLVPLFAGASDRCLLAPLFGEAIKGKS